MNVMLRRSASTTSFMLARAQAQTSLAAQRQLQAAVSIQSRNLATASAKKKKKGKKGGDDDLERGQDSYDRMVKALEGKKKQFPTLSEEEREADRAIAQKYNIEYQRQYRSKMSAIQTQVHLKWHAMRRLPAELREEAEKVDTVAPPLSRMLPRDLPPHPEERALVIKAERVKAEQLLKEVEKLRDIQEKIRAKESNKP